MIVWAPRNELYDPSDGEERELYEHPELVRS
jgi:hypothetical protein